MNIRNLSKEVLGSLAVAGLLAGCSSGGSQSALTPSAMTPTQSHSAQSNGKHTLHSLLTDNSALKGQTRTHARHGIPKFSAPPKSVLMRMKAHPNAAGGPFLYFTDAGTNTLYIYKYTFGYVTAFYAAITAGLSEPQGVCEGKSKAPGTVGKGIVWVTNTLSSQIYGFTRGPGGLPNTSPTYVVNVLDPDPGYFPVGCSLDPVTGNLAVSDIEDVLGGVGNVAIFTPSQQAISDAPPSAVYFAGNLQRYYFTGYDGSGNLWVDGLDSTLTTFEYAELPGGVGPGNPTTLLNSACSAPLAISFPGQVEYDTETKWMTVGDQGVSGVSPSIQYEFTGGQCQIRQTPEDVLSPPATTPNTDVVQSWIDVKTDRLFAPDAANGYVSLYQYTDGHGGFFPVQIGSGFSLPIGSALLR